MENRSLIVENYIDARSGISRKIPINLLKIVHFVFAKGIVEIAYNKGNPPCVFATVHATYSWGQNGG